MDPIIGKTEEKLELLSSNEFVRQLAEARAKAQRDWKSSMSGSRAEGIAEGMAEGKAEVVRNLLRKGMELDFISDVTGLSLREIERISRDEARD